MAERKQNVLGFRVIDFDRSPSELEGPLVVAIAAGMTTGKTMATGLYTRPVMTAGASSSLDVIDIEGRLTQEIRDKLKLNRPTADSGHQDWASYNRLFAEELAEASIDIGFEYRDKHESVMILAHELSHAIMCATLITGRAPDRLGVVYRDPHLAMYITLARAYEDRDGGVIDREEARAASRLAFIHNDRLRNVPGAIGLAREPWEQQYRLPSLTDLIERWWIGRE